jgi:transposase InsO family protein
MLIRMGGSCWLDRPGRHHGTPLPGAGAVHPINGRLRDELLNETLFTSLAQARVALEEWRRDYKRASQHPSVYVAEGKRLF